MTKKNQHVVPHEDGWAVRKGGSKKVTRKTRTSVESGGTDALSNCEILCWDCYSRTL